MSLRTFADNVINLAVESCLICDVPEILTPTKVDRMSEEELTKLAAKSDDSPARRVQLQDEIKILRHGLEKCRKLRLPSIPGELVSQLPAAATLLLTG